MTYNPYQRHFRIGRGKHQFRIGWMYRWPASTCMRTPLYWPLWLRQLVWWVLTRVVDKVYTSIALRHWRKDQQAFECSPVRGTPEWVARRKALRAWLGMPDDNSWCSEWKRLN